MGPRKNLPMSGRRKTFIIMAVISTLVFLAVYACLTLFREKEFCFGS